MCPTVGEGEGGKSVCEGFVMLSRKCVDECESPFLWPLCYYKGVCVL